jgi:hypothetical protein
VIPEPWEFALLALAAFRIWKLVGDDAILDPLRDKVLARLDREGETWSYFVTCPWCAGFWVTALWWLSWLAWDYGTLVAATLFALSAAVGYLGVLIDRLED